MFFTTRGRNLFCSTSSRRYTDFASGLSRRQNTHKFTFFAERISFAEHWKPIAESSEFHLTLRRAHRAPFFPTRNMYTQKAGHFKRKAGKRDGAKKSVSLRPKAVMLTPMVY